MHTPQSLSNLSSSNLALALLALICVFSACQRNSSNQKVNGRGDTLSESTQSGFLEFLTTDKYPDLLVGGPGMTAPVYKWKDSCYVFTNEIDVSASDPPVTFGFAEYCQMNAQ